MLAATTTGIHNDIICFHFAPFTMMQPKTTSLNSQQVMQINPALKEDPAAPQVGHTQVPHKNKRFLFFTQLGKWCLVATRFLFYCTYQYLLYVIQQKNSIQKFQKPKSSHACTANLLLACKYFSYFIARNV